MIPINFGQLKIFNPLCKIQKLQDTKHYILPVHCWIATFLTCCLKLWLLTAELPSCQITEWKMSWQTISGDGFAPINVLDQIPMGSAQAQHFNNKDRFFTFIIWTSSKRLEDAIAAACHYFGHHVVPEWKPKGSHKVIICPVPILITRSGSCNVTFQSCLENTCFKHSSINQGYFA